MLKTVDLTKRYGPRLALDRVSIEVAEGEVLGLLGPNGAGKSTFVSIVAGVRRADAGQVLVDGADAASDPSTVRSRIGFAPQDTGIYEVLTVRENLMYFADLAGLRRKARPKRIDELAAALRLGALLDRTAFELSGGERRRLHTAIAFVNRPPLLLLDEPTVGADIETRAALLEVVRATADDGAAIVYSTHYLPEVEALHATVALLLDGRVIASGQVGELVARHGRAGVEVRFDGPVPGASLGDLASTVTGDTLRVDAADPAAAVPVIMARLGSDAGRVRGVELLRPSLDGVFLALTGRRYDVEQDVPAA